MRRLAICAAVLTACAAAPSTASAADDWYWSEARAESALEAYEPDVSAEEWGADCVGTGRSIRGKYVRHLYRRFYCDVYDDAGEYLGSGEIKITGQSLRRYRWLSFDEA